MPTIDTPSECAPADGTSRFAPVGEPDADRIIETFADVEYDYRAPVSDDTIRGCVRRNWEPFAITLVPPDHASLAAIDDPNLAAMLDSAQRGDLFLFAIARIDSGVPFGVMSVPRPREPWFRLELNEERWCTHAGRAPHEFGIDYNGACELRFLCVQSILRGLAPIVARPGPRICLDELHSRYTAIASAATGPLTMDGVDVGSLARFLESARRASRSAGWDHHARCGENDNAQRQLHALTLEAWPPA